MKPTLWIFALEPISTRYTQQWHEHVPDLLSEQLKEQFNIIQLDGLQKNTQVTPGAFLNFSDTNYWKSSQLCNFLDHYNQGETSANDHFLFTDAWNPVVLQIKYMSDLLGLNWTLHGLWHAGSYDPQDFLGQLLKNKTWVRNAEKSFFTAFDHNYFATKFHIDMFCKNLWGCTHQDIKANHKIVRSGWPMEYMEDTLSPYTALSKKDLIVFPHRIAPEKQVEIFRDLSSQLPQYEFVVCQDRQLTKHEYHTLLGHAKLVFSANLQETLGISTCSEGPLANAIPLAPDRLSYSEIFKEYTEFLYPSDWTENWDSYIQHQELLKLRIVETVENYHKLLPVLRGFLSNSYQQYFSATGMIAHFKSKECLDVKN